MKFIRWVLCGSAIILACVLTRAGEPAHTPAATNPSGPAADLVLRMYPIADLIKPVLDEPLGEGAVPPTQLGSGDLIHHQPPVLSGMAINPRPPPGPAVFAANLMKLIESQIDPKSWGGGRGTSMDTVDEALVVRQTLDTQRQIEEFLKLFRQQREASRSLRVQADWLVLSPGELSLILQPDKDGAPACEVDPDALAKLGTRAIYARGRISCVGGQTVHLLSGRLRTLIENLNSSVGAGASAYAPVIERELSGAALQVTPQ